MNKRLTFVAISLLIGTCFIVGCANRGGILGVDCCADVPSGAIPEPAGTKICNWQTAQTKSAIADQNVLYQADFVGRTTTLSPAATERMSRNAQTNLASVVPWIIEPSGDETLDSARVASVSSELSARGVAATDVQLAIPAALGLYGPQAERVARGFGGNGFGNRGGGNRNASSSRTSTTISATTTNSGRGF